MALPFGFSAGDFIAALELVGTVADALRASGEARSDYRELLRQLYSLETALLQVKRLDVEDYDALRSEVLALKQATSQCQQTIDEFWTIMYPYVPYLRWNGGASRTKSSWYKLKWGVYKKDDVAKFHAKLAGHTEAIQLLISTITLKSMSIRDKKQRSLAGLIQDSCSGFMQRLDQLSGAISTSLENQKQLLKLSVHVLRSNVQIFQAVLQIQNVVSRIPNQLDRQEPVFLVDALGRQTPFHLETIRSWGTLTKILSDNFAHFGAAKKIEDREFVIQDVVTRKDIDFARDWDSCFFPGQRVDMSMVFNALRPITSNSCPGCRSLYTGNSEDEVDCQHCRTIFCRIERLDDDNITDKTHRSPHTQQDNTPYDQLNAERKRKRDAEIGLFRKVRRLAQSSSRSRPGRCRSCNRTVTLEWGRSADGARTLRNACTMHCAKLCKKFGPPIKKKIGIQSSTD